MPPRRRRPAKKAAPASSRPPAGASKKLNMGSRQSKNKPKNANDKKNRKTEAEGKSGAAKAGLVAAGLTAVAAAALVAKSLASFVASDGAKIKFTSIAPYKTNWLSTPTKIEVTWSLVSTGDPAGIPSEVRVLEGDEINNWEGSGIEKLDGKDNIKVIKVTSDNSFVVESKLSDSSAINISDKGTGEIGTSFDDQVAQDVDDVATGIGATLNSLTGGLLDNIGNIIIGIVVFVVVMIIIGLFLKKRGGGAPPAVSSN